MKKFICAILATSLLMTCGIGCLAEEEYYTLPQIREQAAEGWHRSYNDKYGRPLRVDLDIEVFGEETAPVVKACWGKLKDYRLHGAVPDPLGEIQQARLQGNGVSTYLYQDVNGMKVDLDKPYAQAYGNDLTIREARGFLEEILRENGVDPSGIDEAYVWDEPDSLSISYSVHKDTGELLVPAVYNLLLWQKMFDLPILTTMAHEFPNAAAPGIETDLFLTMRDRQAYGLVIDELDANELLAQDMPLCSVDKILESARKLIEDGYVREVYALRFGYTIYTDPEQDLSKPTSCFDIDTWYLVPSWVMYYERRYDPKDNEPPEYPRTSVITINAQTGELPNYFDTSYYGQGDTRYKGFIAWEDVK